MNYNKRTIELVKVNELIAYDNTLWKRSVTGPPDAPLEPTIKLFKDFVLELNKSLVVDPRIKICQLPVGDGLTLCRRII